MSSTLTQLKALTSPYFSNTLLILTGMAKCLRVREAVKSGVDEVSLIDMQNVPSVCVIKTGDKAPRSLQQALY
jgi:hypothetical protein